MAAADTAKLVASLTLDAKGFNAGVKSATGSIGKLEGSIGRVGQKASQGLRTAGRNVGLIGVGVAAGLAVAVKSGLDDLSKLQSAITATDAAIASVGATGQVAGKQVAEWANQIEADIGAAFDDKDITAAAATLLRFGKVAPKNLRPALVVLTDLAVKTGDIDSAANLLAKALADPAKAAGKLAKAGVVLTKAQQDTIKAMVKQNDLAGAQDVILDALSKTTAGAAAASQDKYARSLSILNDVAEDSRKALAEGFLPVIERVADLLSKKLADPKFLNGIREFGNTLAGGLDDLVSIAERLPWGAIGDSLKIAGAGAKAVLNAFVSLPPWVQTAVLTGWGLNKLTGGALGGIVKELGAGLIKGVLGINAAQVNIKAATVTGVGGGAVPGGASAGKSKLGSIAGAVGKVFIVGAAAAAFIELAQILQEQSGQNKEAEAALRDQTQKFTGGASLADLKTSLAGVDSRIYDLQYGSQALTAEGIAYALNIDGVRTAVEQSRADLVSAIQRAEGQSAQHNQQIVDSIHSQSATALQLSAQQQQAAFAVRDAVNAKVGLVAQITNTVKSAVDATSAAARGAGQQAAAAIKDKDLSVSVKNFNSVTTNVSVKDTIRATQKYNSIYRVNS